MLHIATIGTNSIVDHFLAAVAANEGITCTAMFTRNRAHAQALAETYNIQTIYTDLDEMLREPSIDIIYIASPNSLHYPYAKAALLAGKHVFCEKPFMSNLAQCEELIALAKEKGLFLLEAIVTAHMPNYHRLRAWLPKLGTLKIVQSNFSQYSSRYAAYLRQENPNVFNPAFSGGALADIGIYCLHFIVGLFGIPKQLHYAANKGPNGIDTSGCGLLTYDGFLASFTCAKDSRSECITQLQGEKGCITLYSEPSRCSRFVWQDLASGTKEEVSLVQEQNALFYEVRDFVHLIQEQDFKQRDELLRESRQVMQVFEALRKDAGIVFEDDKTAA